MDSNDLKNAGVDGLVFFAGWCSCVIKVSSRSCFCCLRVVRVFFLPPAAITTARLGGLLRELFIVHQNLSLKKIWIIRTTSCNKGQNR